MDDELNKELLNLTKSIIEYLSVEISFPGKVDVMTN